MIRLRSWRRRGWRRKSSSTKVRSSSLLTSRVRFAHTLTLTAEPLTEEELGEKEEYIAQGFPDWSRRDFQQFVKALESYGCDEDFEVYANEIGDKTPDEVERYYAAFKEHWTELPGTCCLLLFLFRFPRRVLTKSFCRIRPYRRPY
jgi:hypothetical protein